MAVLACDDDEDVIVGLDEANAFAVNMTGAKERPNAVTPSGSGTATFTLNETETSLTYSISVSNMTSNITLAHIHLGNASTAGGIIIQLTTPVNNGTVTGTITNTTALGLGLSFGSLVDLIRNGDAYVNVHTSNNPNGEIRGQLETVPSS
jgi:hypothetical protein